MLNQEAVFTTVRALVEDASNIFPRHDRLFIRPDSPLKPFSGRVLRRDRLSLQSLDHGYYYDDENLPVVVSPATQVGREYRFVVAEGRPVTGSQYQATGREALARVESGMEWIYAEKLATFFPAPQEIFVMDICESFDGFRLLELNPFSGADLYHSSPDAVVAAVEACLRDR